MILRLKMKESGNMDKYLNLARELKKPFNTKVTVVPIVINALGTVSKGLERRPKELEVRGRIETIQPTAWLISARIARRVLENRRDLLSLSLS